MVVNHGRTQRSGMMRRHGVWTAACLAAALAACGPRVAPGETRTEPVPDILGPTERYGLSDGDIAALAPDALVKKALEKSDMETLDAAAPEDDLSLGLLCLAHYYGEKTPRDPVAAAAVCARGHGRHVALATYALSLITRDGEGGVAADPAAADALLKEAADAGDARAQADLVAALRTRIPAQARAMAEKCGAQGNLACRFAEAQMKLQGQGGARDVAGGRAAYETLAAAYYPPAVRELGKLLRDGVGGGRDIDEAVIHFKRAEVLGDPEASFLLGQMAEAGQGMPKSAADAIAYYRTAAAGGYEPAQVALKRLGQ
jgi:TPR repeat protein